MIPQDDEEVKEKKLNQLERKRNKLKNSDLLDSLREEFGATPEVGSVEDGGAANMQSL